MAAHDLSMPLGGLRARRNACCFSAEGKYLYSCLRKMLMRVRMNRPPTDTAPSKVRAAQLTWTPKTDPALMRASLSARLGQEKPHETQTPQPRADHPQAAQCRAAAQPRPNSCRCMPSPGGICCHLPPLAASLRRHEIHRGQTAQGAGTGELSAEAFACRGTRPGYPRGSAKSLAENHVPVLMAIYDLSVVQTILSIVSSTIISQTDIETNTNRMSCALTVTRSMRAGCSPCMRGRCSSRFRSRVSASSLCRPSLMTTMRRRHPSQVRLTRKNVWTRYVMSAAS